MNPKQPQGSPSIQLQGLSVDYGSGAVIAALDLNIKAGSFFTLLGPSGCGKTTLLRTIAGFVKASSGQIWFGDREVTQLAPHLRDIGMVFQDYALFPDKTVSANIAYGLHARRLKTPDIVRKVGEALERVGLDGLGDRLPAALSGGQRQRVALARALVIEPQVLLMDEPLSNLDANLRVLVRQTIAHLQAQAGITTVFVMHDQDEALAMSTHIGVMNKGRLEQIATPSQIYREPATAFVADFVGSANLLPVVLPVGAQAAGLVQVPWNGQTIAATATQDLAAGAAFIMARPETITLNKIKENNSRSTSNALTGKVLSRQFLGEKTSFSVALNGMDSFILSVDRFGAEHDDIAVDAQVGVMFDAASTRVLRGK